MIDFLLDIIIAGVSTFGFAILFRVDFKYIGWGVIGGGLSWAVYLLSGELIPNTFFCALMSAVFATVYSELLAYICKTPTTVFLMQALIPLVPGGSLYYTMSNLIMKDYAMAAAKGIATMEVILGVSGGVVAASLAVYAIRHIKKTKHDNKLNSDKSNGGAA